MRTKISVLIMSVGACLYAAHFIVVDEYIIHNKFKMYKVSDIMVNYAKRRIYQFVIHFIFLFVGPMTLLVIMNVKIIYAVQAMRRRRTDMGINNRDNVIQMIVTVVVVFIICQLPYHMRNLINFNMEIDGPNYDSLSEATASISVSLGQLLVCCNSSVNFLIYCLLGNKFRLILVQMISCN